MRFAVSEDGKTFDEPLIFDTPQNFDEALKVFGGALEDVRRGRKIESGAGGIAGVWNKERTELVFSPHLAGWVGKPIKVEFQKILGGPVFVANDADLVGLGEASAGAGQGYKIVTYITVSTGVGGTRIVSGAIEKSVFGFEPGHQIIDISASIEPHLNPRGTIEDFVSGSALHRRTGKHPREIFDSHIWDELAERLAYGLHNTILHWSPDVVVLGGAMMIKSPGISIERVREYLKKIMKTFPELPDLKLATLGERGGLHGALAYLSQMSNKPQNA